LPLFRTKKEPFEWIISGKKTIDVRKGNPKRGETVVYLSGRKVLKKRISKTETGKLSEVVHLNNFKQIIPSAETIEEAIIYLRKLYFSYEDVFTAYYFDALKIEFS
jgi:ASC-1-like (ASCH) protein